MSIEIKVPPLPESVADATISAWHKKPGEFVKRDENLVDLETDKVVLEVPALQDGVLESIAKPVGATVTSNEIIGLLNTDAASSSASSSSGGEKADKGAAEPKKTETAESASAASHAAAELSPSVRRLVAEQNVDVGKIQGSGKGGRITKADVIGFVEQAESVSATSHSTGPTERVEKRVPMTRLRARIAERLLSAQHNAAILTTFNEVDLHAVMQLRNQYKDTFEKTHNTRLGFMSFFVKAVIEALKRFPNVNASIDGNDVIYHGYFDIGIAVSTERGLVVPILRDADKMNFAKVESTIAEYGKKARDGQLTLEEMTGGTFTITNGGVFGSLLSTPILNPPQSAILGMHKIEERVVVENGEMVVRPMMYLALSYDHRIIDGKESVQFLVTVKQMLEDPARLLLEV
jgi:2-oxoglutarate dehydrogenase E2 component (dihydrolipoamide succinyltransferase)